MKKLIFIVAVLFATAGYASAQELGLRFGSYHSSGGVSVDGVFGLAKFSRIHADVSFYNSGVGIEAMWDFLYRPLGGEAFNWYLGAGPITFLGDPFMLGVAGEIGLEYRFNKVPLALGVDWRPSVPIVSNTEFWADVFGLNIRYVFGNKK